MSTRAPFRAALRVAAITLVAIAMSLGAAGGAAADDSYRLRIERIDTLSYPNVRVVASVVDSAGRPVRGLSAGDLKVTEDGTAVAARVDLASASAPIALAFVLDASGSMAGGPLQEAILASNAMVQRLGARDQAALITFRDSVEVVQALTTDKAALNAATKRVVPDRSSLLASSRAFSDALTAAGDTLQKAAPGSRGAVVLVTDGFDATLSAADRAAAIAQARGSLYPIYAVAVGAQLDRATFRAIADASGGQPFFAPSSAELATAYSALGEQILTQYGVTYYSPKPGQPGEGRSVRLQLVRSGVVVAETLVAYAVPVTSGVAAAAPAAPAVAAAPAEAPAAAAPAAEARVPTALNAGEAFAVIAPGVIADPAIGVAVLGAAAIFSLFVFLSNGILGSAAKVRGRLRKFVPAPTATGLTSEQTSPLLQRLLRGGLSGFGEWLRAITPNALITSTAASLEQAGNPFGLAPVEFLGLRAAMAIASSLVLSVAALLTGAPIEGIVLMAGLGLPLGFTAPAMLLGRLVKARRKDILRVLPSTVDMIALSVEAGLAFDGAIAQVALRRKNALADEFRRLLVEFQMGRPRKDALRELASRCGVPEVGRFMNAVTQADTLGAPLSKVLADFAFELRTKRRQRAEELARTAPIKMLFPMIGLIFPALFIVILGPAVPRMLALFTTVGH